MKKINVWSPVLISLAAVAVIAAFLSGCMVGPDYKPPQTKVPAAWSGVTQTPGQQPSVVTAAPAELACWWTNFHDPKLTGLVQEALRANLTVKQAEAVLREARASRGIAASGLWPSVGSSASYLRQGFSANTPKLNGQGEHNDQFKAGFDALWELDIFGGTRRNVESANATIQAKFEGIHDAQVTLAAEVALDYVQLRGAQQEIVIAQNNLKAQEHTADITRQRFAAGFVSALDVANADAQVATTLSTIPVLQTTAQQSIYALSVLLARAPGDLNKELSETGSLPPTPPEVPAGLPSDLLRRRPDIRVAEANVHAATAQIGVAVADLFPKFSLTGDVTWQANLVQNWFNNSSRSFSVGPAATWAIFQGGKIRSNIQLQEATRDENFIIYQKAVLNALQEVENSLVAFSKEWEHRKALNDAVVYNRSAVDLSTQLYTEGQTDFLNVLNAQRSLYASEEALVQSTRDTSTDLISLYKALGGGWEGQAPLMDVGK